MKIEGARLWLGSLPWLGAIFMAHGAEALPADPAELVRRYEFASAREAFALRTGREAQLAAAACLLGEQPKTSANLEAAVARLSQLVAVDSGDETGIAASYLLARVDEVHRLSPDYASAERRYREVYERHPEHPLGQQAMVKWSRLQLLVLNPAGSSDAAWARVEQLGGRITEAAARRDFHLLLAYAGLECGRSAAAALEHLLAAEKAGIQSEVTRANVQVAIGELARETGRGEVALAHFREFLARNPRDARADLVRSRLAELAGRPMRAQQP